MHSSAAARRRCWRSDLRDGAKPGTRWSQRPWLVHVAFTDAVVVVRWVRARAVPRGGGRLSPSCTGRHRQAPWYIARRFADHRSAKHRATHLHSVASFVACEPCRLPRRTPVAGRALYTHCFWWGSWVRRSARIAALAATARRGAPDASGLAARKPWLAVLASLARVARRACGKPVPRASSLLNQSFTLPTDHSNRLVVRASLALPDVRWRRRC